MPTAGTDIPEHLGPMLREARDEKALTAQGLADKLRVSRRSIYNWESGRSEPRVEQLKPLGAELDLSWRKLARVRAAQIQAKRRARLLGEGATA